MSDCCRSWLLGQRSHLVLPPSIRPTPPLNPLQAREVPSGRAGAELVAAPAQAPTPEAARPAGAEARLKGLFAAPTAPAAALGAAAVRPTGAAPVMGAVPRAEGAPAARPGEAARVTVLPVEAAPLAVVGEEAPPTTTAYEGAFLEQRLSGLQGARVGVHVSGCVVAVSGAPTVHAHAKPAAHASAPTPLPPCPHLCDSAWSCRRSAGRRCSSPASCRRTRWAGGGGSFCCRAVGNNPAAASDDS